MLAAYIYIFFVFIYVNMISINWFFSLYISRSGSRIDAPSGENKKEKTLWKKMITTKNRQSLRRRPPRPFRRAIWIIRSRRHRRRLLLRPHRFRVSCLVALVALALNCQCHWVTLPLLSSLTRTFNIWIIKYSNRKNVILTCQLHLRLRRRTITTAESITTATATIIIIIIITAIVAMTRTKNTRLTSTNA